MKFILRILIILLSIIGRIIIRLIVFPVDVVWDIITSVITIFPDNPNFNINCEFCKKYKDARATIFLLLLNMIIDMQLWYIDKYCYDDNI